MRRGIIKSFNKSKGCGFISDHGVRGRNVFFHISDIHGALSKVKVKEVVAFELSAGRRGLSAYNIHIGFTEYKKPDDNADLVVVGKHAGVLVEQKTEQRQVDTKHYLKVETPLMIAAKEGDLSKLMSLLASGVDKDAQEERGRTALMLAASRGHSNMVRQLLDAGADMRLKTIYGDTAYTFAVHGKHKECMDLLKAIADISPRQLSNSSTEPSKEIIEIEIKMDERHYTPRLSESSDGFGHMCRDNGQFGSFMKHDNYGEDGNPDTTDDEFYDLVNR